MDNDTQKPNAITIKEIKGERIPTISIGTKFIVKGSGEKGFSPCSGLPITSIFNDEFAMLPEEPAEPIDCENVESSNKTYQDLLNELLKMSPERLKDNISVYDFYEKEFSEVTNISLATKEEDVIDVGHLFLTV